MQIPSFLDIATSIILAASPGQCVIPEAPIISVKPVTENIQYDFTKTSAELTAMKSDTISPYGIGVDTVTRGLRHDQPKMNYTIEFGVQNFPKHASFCAYYKKIEINIELSPKIYIAKGYHTGKCGKFILEHEKRHVLVDRQVMNKYARLIGESVQRAVHSAGAQGPHNVGNADSIRDSMNAHIDSAINAVMLPMRNEMNARQQAIDSREEYDAGAKACAYIRD